MSKCEQQLLYFCTSTSLENLLSSCFPMWPLCNPNQAQPHQTSCSLPQLNDEGFLKLSNTSLVSALHFLLGELPLEAHIQINTLMLFYNVWCNPCTTDHDQVMYILKKYILPSPLQLTEEQALWPKVS